MTQKKLKELLASMTVEEKAAQLTQVNGVSIKKDTQAELTGVDPRFAITLDEISRVGSVLNFASAEEAKEIQNRYLERSEKKIPLVMMMDVIHGYRTIFPIPLAMGATFDPALTEECAKMSAVEARCGGVQATFAPMVDLARDQRWGRVMETSGEDPYLNGEMGKAYIRGFHAGGLACCVKHFAAYGAAEAGRDYNTTDMSAHSLAQYYLYAYGECLKENPELVMSSFNALNGKPVNANKGLLIDLLRNEWKFNGVVISDYDAVWEMIAHGYTENEKECARIAINNEIDMEMVSTTYINYLPELLEEGAITEKKVDKMVGRVLALKNKLGLFENPYYGMDVENAEKVFLSAEYRNLARIAAEKSFILLKNEKEVLPLKKTEKIACVGPFAAERGIIGAWACNGRKEDAVSVLQGLENYLGESVPSAKGCGYELLATDESGIKSAVKAAKKAKTVIACIGEYMDDSGEGASRSKLNLPAPQIALLKALKEKGKKVVAVVFGGRAQELDEVEKYSDAILYVWQPGTEGGNAVARTLYGEVNPSGKTTVSFPRTVGQMPLYYNAFRTGRPKPVDDFKNVYYVSSYRDVLNSPLYPFGYGLSYTKFEISNLTISATEMDENGEIEVSVLVKNVGKYDGEEVVQLYLRDHHASMIRTVKELKAYKKIFLKAGEEQRVEFAINEKTLRFYNADFKYVSEKGKFSVMVGNSSENVLEKEFILK
ncbi:MAG: glycoside hydrolase family 3 C-terminal domain-containing protein [Clostridia bacterium]|nr:glycoside hydrolase family 3 C-terminal domain-containing protein [Clostridia bacterium]